MTTCSKTVLQLAALVSTLVKAGRLLQPKSLNPWE